jgi:hypothetical protein
MRQPLVLLCPHAPSSGLAVDPILPDGLGYARVFGELVEVGGVLRVDGSYDAAGMREERPAPRSGTGFCPACSREPCPSMRTTGHDGH